ncbi:MAG: ABC transporter ATP-binding protein, partial [Pseudonocardiaceae bacterium]
STPGLPAPLRTALVSNSATAERSVTPVFRSESRFRPRAKRYSEPDGGATEKLVVRAGLERDVWCRYPHELSGGMAQRVGVASALAGNPSVVLADEPTAGLDRPLVDRTVDQLAALAADGHAVLLITHDLRAAHRVATDLAVMYASRIVECGPADEMFSDPWHPYTRGLLAALPDRGFTTIPGDPPELTALPSPRPVHEHSRATPARRTSARLPPGPIQHRAMLTGTGIEAGYLRNHPVLRAVDIEIAPGEVVGLAGPSGCGKSTLARVLALLLAPWSGRVDIDGAPAAGVRYRAPRQQRTAIGVVFQQPRVSVDPRLTLRQAIIEPLRACQRRLDEDQIAELTDRVGLTAELLGRRPHEVSDGQLQRACLARALILQPRYLICDEMTAMLDASTTAALVDVVSTHTAQTGAGVLAISHDEALLAVWAHRVQRISA